MILQEERAEGVNESIGQYSSFGGNDMLLKELFFNQRRVSSKVEIPQSYCAIYSSVSNHTGRFGSSLCYLVYPNVTCISATTHRASLTHHRDQPRRPTHIVQTLSEYE